MTVITRRPAVAPPLRTAWIVLLAVLLAAALAAGAAVVGSRLLTSTLPDDGLRAMAVPAPYGPARNGLIAYGSDGDIHAYDPATGVSRPLVAGPEFDLGPAWSPDGTHLAFARKVDGGDDHLLLMVVDADGQNIMRSTPDPVTRVDTFLWSPDGSLIAISGLVAGVPTLQLLRTDGSGVDLLETGMRSFLAGWKPTQGAELLFRATTADGVGLYTIPVGGGTPTLVLAGPTTIGPKGWEQDLQFASYSPDGSQLVYSSRAARDVSSLATDPVRIHLVNADGSGDRVLDVLDAAYEDWASWSPDGTSVSVVTRTGGDHQLAIVPVDGKGPVVASERRPDPDGMGQAWSADGTQVLTWRAADGVISAVDTATGASTDMPWQSDANPDWQRLAP